MVAVNAAVDPMVRRDVAQRLQYGDEAVPGPHAEHLRSPQQGQCSGKVDTCKIRVLARHPQEERAPRVVPVVQPLLRRGELLHAGDAVEVGESGAIAIQVRVRVVRDRQSSKKAFKGAKLGGDDAVGPPEEGRPREIGRVEDGAVVDVEGAREEGVGRGAQVVAAGE